MKKILNSISGVIFGAGMIFAFIGMCAADSNLRASIVITFTSLGAALVSSYIMEVTKDDAE